MHRLPKRALTIQQANQTRHRAANQTSKRGRATGQGAPSEALGVQVTGESEAGLYLARNELMSCVCATHERDKRQATMRLRFASSVWLGKSTAGASLTAARVR